MSREIFQARKFGADKLAEIERANRIIDEYRAAGFRLTLRQLYYQHVARDLIPNTLKEYNYLGWIMTLARDAGLSDWDVMEDRSRRVEFHSSWPNPSDFISDAINSYAEDPWEGQRHRPEVWIEKDALLGVIAPVCRRLRLPYFSTKGNVGQLPVHDAGLRFADQLRLGLVPVVLHLADHDPTGIEMTFDLERRLSATIEALRAELKPLNAADGNGPIDLPNPLQRRGLN